MRFVWNCATFCCVLMFLVAWPDRDGPWPRASGGAATHASRKVASHPFGRVPPAFVANLGQWAHEARFVARFGAVTVLLDERGWWVNVLPKSQPREPRAAGAAVEDGPAARAVALRMSFAGSDASRLAGEDRRAETRSYFIGSDPRQWRTAVPCFGAVTYSHLYPGIDLRAYGKDGHFEYDFSLAPGAELASVEVRVDGADALRIDADGALIIDTPVGPLRQPRPLTSAVAADGMQQPVDCRYELRGNGRFGFVAPAWDRASRLVLDPGLIYSTLLGGSLEDFVYGLAVDAAGVVTVAGYATSVDFPTSPGAYATSPIGLDVVVARLDPSLPTVQQLRYATYLGGSNGEAAQSVAVDAAGVTTVMGSTSSANFPTTANAFDTTYNTPGLSDLFIARLDPRLSGTAQLVYSSFLGGSDIEEPSAMHVDATGVVTFVGETRSADFPTTPGAYDRTYSGTTAIGDAYVARLDPSLTGAQQLTYSTFLGGGVDSEAASAVKVDVAGVITTAGFTRSPDFPTTPNAFDTVYSGGSPFGSDGFVTRLDPRLPGAQQLVYSTFLGGAGSNAVNAIAVDGAGVVTATGWTASVGFPTTPGAWNTTTNGKYDAFVTRLDPRLSALQQLVYSTLVGGAGDEYGNAISVDNAGVVTVAGWSNSANFPVTAGAYDTTFNGGAQDVTVFRLDPSLPTAQQLVYATFVGSSDRDVVGTVHVDPAGVVTTAGWTASSGFPTTPGAWDTTFAGSADSFVIRLDMLPTGARVFGRSSPGCTGPLAVGVTSAPRIGNATFAFTCNNAPPSAQGALLLAARGLTSPFQLLGIDLYVDPSSPWLLAPATTSNAAGGGYFSLPLPPNPGLIAQTLDAQFVWLGPTSPPCPPLGLSASNALEVTIQP